MLFFFPSGGELEPTLRCSFSHGAAFSRASRLLRTIRGRVEVTCQPYFWVKGASR